MLRRRDLIRGTLAGAAMSSLGPGAPAQTSRRAQSKIDIHVHLGRDRKEMLQITSDKVPGAVKHLIGEMDKYNIEKSVIVAAEPMIINEPYIEAGKLEPQRLVVAVGVIPRPINVALDRVKAYRDRGAKALKLQPLQFEPYDPAVERLVAEAVKAGMPVLIHHMDTPKSLTGFIERLAMIFPEGNFVVVHFGGVYGFWDVLPLSRLPNVYLETSMAFHQIVKSPLKSMLHFLSAENRLNKLIFGSEIPVDYESVVSAIDDLLGPQAKDEVVRAVYRGNAEKILKLF